MKVTEEQQRFVATNQSSVVLCYVLAANGGGTLPLQFMLMNRWFIGFR